MTKREIESIVGPRVSETERRAHRARYLAPSVLLASAAVLLLVSLFLPYWRMTLHAPQYPKGLTVTAYLNRLEGDVHEIDGLNHYIGMRKLDEAARLERELSGMAVASVALLVLGAIFIHNRRAAWLALPSIAFPIGFLGDLHLWLASFGNHLDPHAPLSSSIKPFTPPVLGVGVVGQFRTVAYPAVGMILAWIAALAVIAGLYFHRRAYKPLVEASRHAGAAAAAIALVGLALSGSVHAAAPFDVGAAVAAAPAGSIVHVPAGVHRGTVVIDRPITLEGEPGSVLEGDGDGDVVRVVAPGVTVRELTVRKTGTSLDKENAGILVLAPDATIENVTLEDVMFGVYARRADRIVVRGCSVAGKDFDSTRRGDSIRLWSCTGGLVEGNRVRHSRDVVVWFSKGTRVLRNEVRDSRYGLHLMYAEGTTIEDNVLEGNSVGAFLMYSAGSTLRGNRIVGNRGPSGYGIGLKDNDSLVAERNELIGNRVGIYVDNSPNSIDSRGTIRDNRIACNDIGIGFLPAVQRNDVSGNVFVDNLEQVAILGPGEFHGNAFTVAGRGNYWSDYRGYDLDGDGIGDLPYRAESVFEDLMDRHPELRLFQFSAAQQAIDLAVRAFPVVRPRPKLTDTAPLIAAPRLTPPTPGRATRAPFAAVSATLLLAFGSAAALTRSRLVPRREAAVAPARELPLRVEPAPGRPMVRVVGVEKRYGRFVAVRGASFVVERGEAVALWGPNGAGKSTLLKCLLGLVRFRGTIAIDGLDTASAAKAARSRLGYVPQELAFWPEWTGSELLAFLAKLKRVPPERVASALAEVGLAAHGGKPIGSLSGGMKQRLALAGALLSDPPLLVLDEITSSLDSGGREGLLAVLSRLKESGKTIVFTSHRRDDVARLADRVLVLERGRLVAEIAPSEVEEPSAHALEDLA